MKVGRRLAVKVLNASKFVLGLGAADVTAGDITEPIDRAMLAQLDGRRGRGHRRVRGLRATTGRSSGPRRSSGGSATTTSSWSSRAPTRGGRGRPVRPGRAGASALSVHAAAVRAFLPFVTEEVWSWWQEGSVHRAAWPTASELRDAAQRRPTRPCSTPWPRRACRVRKAKSAEKKSQRHEVLSLVVGRRARGDSEAAAGRDRSAARGSGHRPGVQGGQRAPGAGPARPDSRSRLTAASGAERSARPSGGSRLRR